MSTRVPSVSRKLSRRTGAIAVLAVFMLVPVIVFVAFAVDLGHLCVVREQIQNLADAAALAAAWDLLDERRFEGEYSGVYEAVRNTAAEYAGMNLVAGSSPELDTNVNNSLSGEFSRPPRINNESGHGTPGRDHWGASMFCLLGGGGIRGGQIVGSTDRKG